MPATRLAAKPPMMLLVGSRLRPATGPAAEPVRARAAGARVGPATHHPVGGRPLPVPATASAAAPTTTAGYISPATLIVACSALEARAPTVPPAQVLRWSINYSLGSSSRGVREVKVLARSSVVTPSQTSGRVRRRELLLLLAAAVATSSDGAT